MSADRGDLARAYVSAFGSVQDAINFLVQHSGELDVELFPSDRGSTQAELSAIGDCGSPWADSQRRWVGRVTAPRHVAPVHPSDTTKWTRRS